MSKAKIEQDYVSGLPAKGLSLSRDSDGGITVKSSKGIVLSIIEKPHGLIVEGYAYLMSQTEAWVESIDPKYLRNPRSKVTVWTVQPRREEEQS